MGPECYSFKLLYTILNFIFTAIYFTATTVPSAQIVIGTASLNALLLSNLAFESGSSFFPSTCSKLGDVQWELRLLSAFKSFSGTFQFSGRNVDPRRPRLLLECP